MCSIPGIPTPGSNISVFITRVNLDPQCEFVELWGRFDQDRKTEYQRLQKEIQFPRETLREFEGDPGDQCLVQVYKIWNRARIVSKSGSRYTVFLIDEGRMLGATTSMLAWGQKEFFHLPPELEFCVLSNVLPLSTENRWSPMALEFLNALCGKTVDAFVQDVLVPHRTFLLDIPFITRQMHEMGFTKKSMTEKFKFHVLQFLQRRATNSTYSLQKSSIRNVHEQKEKQQQHYLYPELQMETVETVIVTEVTNPLRVFCQLKVFSQELKKLTEQITQHYEGRLAACIARSQTLGSPCASRGSDGRWYRSVLQQVVPDKNLVEVLHVDYGKKQFVQVENIRPLATDFFRMPVITYVCSLHGILDKGVGWTAAQIEYLKSLLLNRTVIAKFEYHSLSEGVHYVTLYGDENTNINNLFGKKERCLLDFEKSHGNDDVCNNNAGASNPNRKVNQETLPCSGDSKEVQIKYHAEDLLVNSSHLAVVQHVESLSEFWVQTNMYADEFDQMMNDLADLYRNPVSAGVVECPQVGLYCAGRSQDNSFYRATVSEINGNKVKVFFVDYGNSEIIDCFNLGVLPDKFKDLPKLAYKCRLSGIEPKDGKWSQNATDFFIKTIADKILDLHVTARSCGSYIVQLTDLSAQGETDVGKLVCSAGFAEKFDSSIPPRKTFTGPTIAPTTQNPHAISYDVFKSSVSPQHLSTSNRTAFKEYLFPIGSSFDVTVSYIESLNDFWCQLAQNSNNLKRLMQDIQKHYAVTKFGPSLEAACVARHPDSGMWYRALVIQKHATMHVDVLFVDYGQTKTVSVQDLCAIDPKFLQLKGQAFRCSLYNLIHPASHTTECTEEAITQFQNFVDNATNEHGMLKCTIYAVMNNAQKVVFNVVDLQTPFQSVCDLLVKKGLANHAPAMKAPSSLFRLETYYYSTHNIKTGSEEEVIVTSVKSVNQFYCLLKRNSDTIEGLSKSVNKLCHQLEMTNCPKTFGTVCFAKYTDGEWYRAQIKCTYPTILVQFVDYGDTLEVKNSDLLPIPIEANEIMSVPVQAVQCGLSDIPEEVSSQVNCWFETHVTDRNFMALVVAKEPGGKLLVELYDDKMQMNAMMKEKFKNEMHSKGQVMNQSSTAQALKPKPRFTPPKLLQTDEDFLKCEKLPRVHNRIPREMQAALRRPNEKVNSEPAETTKLQEELNPEAETEYSNDAYSSLIETQKSVVSRANINCLPKLLDLPSKSVKPGLVADVFVSHFNSPQSFFVQLIEEEAEIYSLVEKLNVEQSTAISIEIKDLGQGDLVNAVFPEDYSWYRAVVREILENEMALVEFVDFGNTATVSVSDMCRLDKHFLEIPRFSICCCLCGVPTAENKLQLDSDVVSKFQVNVGISGTKPFGCMFVKQSGSVWEVKLVDGDQASTCNISPGSPTDFTVLLPETPEKLDREAEECKLKSAATNVLPKSSSFMSAHYGKPEISEGQSLEVYASTINGPQLFWCQSADSGTLDKITEVVVEAGKAVASTFDTETLCTGSLCIALFKDDEQWYRAKVLRKDADTLSVLFVDYGNESTVTVKDVRPIPALLVDIPPQAFWCQLEGFDFSRGFWDATASDQLSELLMNKLLDLTIVRISSQEEGGITCFVKIQCGEEVINDTMKLYWKSSVDNRKEATEENKSNPTDETVSCDMSSLADELQLANKKAAVLDLHLKKQSENVQDHDAQPVMKTHEELVDEDKCTDLYYEQRVFVITQVTDNFQDNVDLIHFQDRYCLDYGNSASIVNELVEEKLSKTTEIQEHKTVSLSLNSAVKAPNEGIETKSIIICEGPRDAGLECLSDGGDSSETQPATSQMCNDKSGSASAVKKALSLDDSESQLYINKDFASLSNVYQSHDDIYEDVFRICAEPVVESEKSKRFVLEELKNKHREPNSLAEVEFEIMKEESGIQNEAEDHNEFGQLYRVEQTFSLGSSCFVWSSAMKSWCNAKIVKIFEDSIKVLLDDDTEMLVDPERIFPLPSEQEQIGDIDSASLNPGSERDHKDTDGCKDAIAGDRNAFSEIQDDCFSSDACAPLKEFSNVLKEQLIDIGQANYAEVVLRASTQEKDDGMLEEDSSCHGDLTSELIKDYTDHRAECEKNIFPEVVSNASPHEKEDPGESTAPNKDCSEVVMSHVMHLTLKVEERSDNDIIFLSETVSNQELQ